MDAVKRGVAAAFLAFGISVPVGGDEAPLTFHLSYIPIHGRRLESLFYDFDGDGKADLLNISIDFDKIPHERWLALHRFRNGAFPEKPDRVWGVSDRAGALVFADVLPGGGTEIGFVAEDGVYAYPWEKDGPSETPLKIIHARTFFRAASMNQIPVWWWKTDLDSDGRDDIAVPVGGGYRIYFQTAPGVFGRTATLEADLAAGAPRFLAASSFAQESEVIAAQFTSVVDLPRLQPVDINGDGLLDLVTIRDDTIRYFFQKEAGVFPSVRPFRMSFPVATLKDEAKKDTVNLAMIRFVDIDQDKLADLVVTRIEGTLGLWDSIKTSIYLHRGTGRGNFSADKRILIDGVSIDPEFIDMDLDGKLDAVTSRLRTDLMKQAVAAFVLGDITISYEVFQYDPAAGVFMTSPVYEKQIFVAKGDLEKTGAGAVPLVFIRGDLTGDGRPDLLLIDPKRNELNIHPGVVRQTGSGPRIGFDGTAHFTIPIDRHPKGIAVADVNSDGVNDVILYHAGMLGLVLSKK
jgi:hypothetical protein